MIDLVELKQIERAAIAMLTPLGAGSILQVVKALKPADEDYARVFVGDAGEKARVGYQHLWTAPPKHLARPGQTTVLAVATPADSFLTDNPYSREFPGGYRKIADKLHPERIWVRFKYVEPGKTSGMAYDGLVWLDGRWGWFPKPWNVLLGDGPVVDN